MHEAEKMYKSGKIVDGIFRWNSNNSVPFDDVLSLMVRECLITPAVAVASSEARQKDNDAFLEAYKKSYRGPSDEERAEMRAAFGPGQTVVNVLTGDRITT